MTPRQREFFELLAESDDGMTTKAVALALDIGSTAALGMLIRMVQYKYCTMETRRIGSRDHNVWFASPDIDPDVVSPVRVGLKEMTHQRQQALDLILEAGVNGLTSRELALAMGMPPT